MAKDIRAILAQGGDPRENRFGLAALCGVSLEVVDAAIDAAGAPVAMHPEDAAQIVLAMDRRERRESPAVAREWEHEEE